MKKSLKKMLTPSRSFEDWAFEHNLPLKRKHGNRINFIARIAYGCTSLLILVLALLPFSLKNKNQLDEPKYYSSQDVVSKPISSNDIYSASNLIFFSIENVIQFQKVTVDVTKENDSLILSYNVNSAIIITKDEQNVFEIDFIARVYPNYEFYGINNFNNLSDNISLNDVKINANYEIKNGIAFVFFSYSGIDYFMTVKEYGGITEINNGAVVVLLTELFC